MFFTCFSWNRYSIFKNKGLLVVLVWSVSIFNVFHLFEDSFKNNIKVDSISIGTIIFIASLLLSPLFGLVADVCWSRYKMIRRLLWLLWVSCSAHILFDSLLTSVRVEIKDSVLTVTFLVMSLCLSGLLTNMVQFGTDQIFDGSSADIAAFISWFVWLFHFSKVVLNFVLNCVSSTYEPFAWVFLVSLWLTIAVCLDSLCSHLLIKEPISLNPLKLIYEVLKFYSKNKYPRLRSAFTYWEDKPYSRIDLGKAKYGGPFTAEQVEDVKTFIRMVIILIIACFSSGFYLIFYNVPVKINSLYLDSILQDHDCKKCFYKCILKTIHESSGFILSLIWLPLYELGLHRLFGRWLILNKLAVGYFILLFVMIGYLVIEIFDYTMFEKSNATTCLLLQNSYDNARHIQYYWYMIPNSMLGIGQFLVIASAVDFMCAQSPYSMKGLLFGLVYGFLALGICLAFSLTLPIQFTLKYWPLREKGRCKLWILLAGNIVILALFLISCCVFLRYKKRSRDDTEFNEHMFVVNYYDRYLRHKD